MLSVVPCAFVALICACGGATRPPADDTTTDPSRLAVAKYPTRRIAGEHAQIAGTVRELGTGEPLGAVLVKLRSDPRDIAHPLTTAPSITTDEHGRYVFPDVEPGRDYQLFFIFEGLLVGAELSATAGFETIVDVHLDMSRIEGEPVRVGARVP